METNKKHIYVPSGQSIKRRKTIKEKMVGWVTEKRMAILSIAVIVVLAAGAVLGSSVGAKSEKIERAKGTIGDYVYYAKNLVERCKSENINLTESEAIKLLNEWMPDDMDVERAGTGYAAKTLKDPWGTPYNIAYFDGSPYIVVWSNGADKVNNISKDVTGNNTDDIIADIANVDGKIVCSITDKIGSSTMIEFSGNGYKIPNNCMYRTAEGVIYNENESLPIDYKPQTGDTFASGDYTYMYNYEALYDEGKRECSWIETDNSGWGVRAGEPAKEEYAEMESFIGGGIVKSLSGAFADCENMVAPPTIPTCATNLNKAFYSCKSLKEMPSIPNSVKTMEQTFWGCAEIKSATKIPESVENMVETFAECTYLSGDVYVNANPYEYDGCFEGTSWKINLHGDGEVMSKLAETTSNKNIKVS